MTDRWLIPTLLTFLILVLAAVMSAESAAVQQQRLAIERTRRRLDAIAGGIEVRAVGKALVRSLFTRVRGRSASDAEVVSLVARELRDIASGAIEVHLTDRDENPLWSSNPRSELFRLVRARLGSEKLPALGLRVPAWRLHRLSARPNIVAVWRLDRRIKQPGIAGVLYLIDKRLLHPQAQVSLLLSRWRDRGERFGYWNRVTGGSSHLPPEIAAAEMSALLQRFLRQQRSSVPVGEDQAVLVPMSGTGVLVGVARKPPLRIPDWLHALVVMLGFGWFGRQRATGGSTLSLRWFVGLSLLVAAGLPLVLTWVFWSLFEENRTRSLEKEQFARLEQHLINLDRSLPEVIRRREKILSAVCDRLERSLDHLDPHIRDLNRLEIENQVFESGFFVSSEGVHLRGFGFQETSLRQTALLDRDDRRRRIQEFLENGLFTPVKWLKAALEQDLEPESVRRIWDCIISRAHQTKMESGISVLGKVIVQRYNQEVAGVETQSPSGGKQDLVYGAMIDSQTGDMIQGAIANFRRAIALGTGEISSFVFVDVLKDAVKRGQYFLLFFMDLRSIQGHFFNELFLKPETWPEDIEFYTDSWYCPTLFPRQGRPEKLRRFLERLQPPRRLLSETTWLNGRKVLLSALAGKNIRHFAVFAVTPWKVIEVQQNRLRHEMSIIAMMMALLMAAISWRLYQSIIAPAERLMEGIRAIEDKRFDHRIPLVTGDEWDELAESFNQTIGSLEELEVAKVVQTQILPQETIRVSEAEFVGRSLMTGQVGGDYFDAIPNEDGSLSFVIGDVTGHGVSAALVVAMVKSAFHFIHRRGVRAPAEMLKQMNAMIIRSLSKKKALSMQIGWYQPGGKLVLANAGHPYPYLLLPHAEVKPLTARGMVLGVTARPRFEEVTVPLDSAGGSLVLFTDGIVEQMNPRGARVSL
ncbi:MAG TPA: SpoIIE family protein phosphatase, partial [Candidatus Ozemobacteraceae bacterium]|nr:SpoIIE family protein phosphatase [Candidatus Ozemobacteraceae bacterium]